MQPRYQSFFGNFTQPFEEDLVFGKIDFLPGDAHLIELSAKIRDEQELTFGDSEPPGHGTLKDNKDRYLVWYGFGHGLGLVGDTTDCQPWTQRAVTFMQPGMASGHSPLQ